MGTVRATWKFPLPKKPPESPTVFLFSPAITGMAQRKFPSRLAEVGDAALEERLVFVAGDILGDVDAAPLGVAHLAQHAPTGADDALDSLHGTVGIEVDRAARIAVEIAVLEGDLPVLFQFNQNVRAGDKLPFAVGIRDGEDIARLHFGKPGGATDRSGVDDRVRVAGNVAANAVVKQRRAVRRDVANFSEGYEAEFDECLKAVADTEREAVAVFQQIHRGVAHGGVTKSGGDEFAGAVGFVARAETAGNHENLRGANRLGQLAEGIVHILRGLVANDEDLRCGSGFSEGAGGIVFAVVAGENRDDDPRFGGAGSRW